jgi:hypothetical protein
MTKSYAILAETSTSNVNALVALLMCGVLCYFLDRLFHIYATPENMAKYPKIIRTAVFQTTLNTSTSIAVQKTNIIETPQQSNIAETVINTPLVTIESKLQTELQESSPIIPANFSNPTVISTTIETTVAKQATCESNIPTIAKVHQKSKKDDISTYILPVRLTCATIDYSYHSHLTLGLIF